MKKILIIDDDPNINEVLKLFAAQLGYAAESVRSGLDAVEKIKSERYWAVICDFTIPDLNGLDIYDKVKVLQSDLGDKFVLLTGAVLDYAADAKAVEQKIKVLRKPFHFEHIMQLLRELEGQSA